MTDKDRTEDIILQMDQLASEDHTHTLTEEERDIYRNHWWLRSNVTNPNTMPVRYQAEFKSALTTLHRLQNQSEWWQRSSSSWWTWNNSWWSPNSDNHHDKSNQQ
jgi:hypothetical protein